MAVRRYSETETETEFFQSYAPETETEFVRKYSETETETDIQHLVTKNSFLTGIHDNIAAHRCDSVQFCQTLTFVIHVRTIRVQKCWF